MNPKYLAILSCLVILVIVGSYFVYNAYLLPEDLRQNQQQDPRRILQPTSAIPALTQPASTAVPLTGSTQEPGAICNTQVADSRNPFPENISNAIRDPIPEIRYSINEGESGRTIVLGKGELVEINLRWIPGLAFHWVIPASGCGLELVNSGVYCDPCGDFWNTTGHYRARYRAVSPGTSFLDGRFVLTKPNAGDLLFNLTVIVK